MLSLRVCYIQRKLIGNEMTYLNSKNQKTKEKKFYRIGVDLIKEIGPEKQF